MDIFVSIVTRKCFQEMIWTINKNECSIAATGPPIYEISISTTISTEGLRKIPRSLFGPRTEKCLRDKIYKYYTFKFFS